MEKFRFIIIFGKKYDVRTAVDQFGWRKMYIYYRLRKIVSGRYFRIRKEFRQMMNAAEIPGKGLKMEADFWLSWFMVGAFPENYFDLLLFHKNRKWKNHHVTDCRLHFIVPLFNTEETTYYLDNKALFNKHWESFLNRKWCEPQRVSFVNQLFNIFFDKGAAFSLFETRIILSCLVFHLLNIFMIHKNQTLKLEFFCVNTQKFFKYNLLSGRCCGTIDS